MKHDRARILGENLVFPKVGKNGEILPKECFFGLFCGKSKLFMCLELCSILFSTIL